MVIDKRSEKRQKGAVPLGKTTPLCDEYGNTAINTKFENRKKGFAAPEDDVNKSTLGQLPVSTGTQQLIQDSR
jgi:hypothetical protein